MIDLNKIARGDASELLPVTIDFRKDTDRMNWLCNPDYVYSVIIQLQPGGEVLQLKSQDLRTAIDEARKANS